MKIIGLSIDDELLGKVDATAKKMSITRSGLLRYATIKFMESENKNDNIRN